MTFNDHTANRQSQADAMRLRREKRIKYAGRLFRIKSWPGIFDRNDNCIKIIEKLVFTRSTPDLGSLVESIASIAF